MKVTCSPVDHLCVKLLRSDDAIACRNSDLLILGNAYGVMPYHVPLAEAMARRGYWVSWFAFSGQDGTAGTLSMDSAVRDITLAVEFVNQRKSDQGLAVIAHCAGGIAAVEYMCQHASSPIRQLIIYGLLFDPRRRQASAEPRMRDCGLRQSIEEDAWDYKWLERLPSIRIPVLFCHSRDSINLSRATPSEIEMASSVVPDATVAWFERGYDTSLATLPQFVETYDRWLSSAGALT